MLGGLRVANRDGVRRIEFEFQLALPVATGFGAHAEEESVGALDLQEFARAMKRLMSQVSAKPHFSHRAGRRGDSDVFRTQGKQGGSVRQLRCPEERAAMH